MNAKGPTVFDDASSSVIAAAIEVHRCLGPGFLESVYEEALIIELGLRGVSVERQVAIPIVYKDRSVGTSRLDLLVDGDLVVELKSVAAIDAIHHAQLRSYLKAGAFQTGLLINFNVLVLRDGIRRLSWPG